MAATKKHILCNLTITHPRKPHAKKIPDLNVGGLAVYAANREDAESKLTKSYTEFHAASKDDSEFRAFLRSKNVVESVVVYSEPPAPNMEQIEIVAP